VHAEKTQLADLDGRCSPNCRTIVRSSRSSGVSSESRSRRVSIVVAMLFVLHRRSGGAGSVTLIDDE
jgi:hypothetical protein